VVTPGGDGEGQPHEVVVEHRRREFVGQFIGRLTPGQRGQKRPRLRVGNAWATCAPTMRNIITFVAIPKPNVAGSIPVARSISGDIIITLCIGQ
jgi:hypothetical protein